MNRGPEPRRASNGDNRTMAEKARDAWGAGLPDWVAEVATMVDAIGLKAVGAKIDYSGSTVSQVCNRKYQGDLAAVEAMARAAILSPTVDCPVLDTITREVCLASQDKPFSAASARSAHLYHACRQCPNARPNLKGNPS